MRIQRKMVVIMSVIDFKPWEVHEFPWGSAVKRSSGEWTHIFIGEQVIEVTGLQVVLHQNGIELCK